MLGQRPAAPRPAALAAQGNTLVSVYDWAFQFGPGLVVGFGNGLMLGYLMYRSGLVPRRMAILGLVGGPLLILSFVLILFGAYDNGSTPSGLMALPEIAWEASLAIYCGVEGLQAEPDRRPPGGGGIGPSRSSKCAADRAGASPSRRIDGGVPARSANRLNIRSPPMNER